MPLWSRSSLLSIHIRTRSLHSRDLKGRIMRPLCRAIPTVICLAASLIPAAAQDGQGQNGPSAEVHPGTPPSNPYKPQAPDSQLQQLLSQIDQNNLQATVQ